MVVENSLLSATMTWPEIVGDRADRMAASYEDDLFTLADRDEASAFDEFDDTDELDTEEGDLVED